MNTLPANEIKRRGLAAIEESLQRGPVHLIKRNRPVAVVLSEEEYATLLQSRSPATAPANPPLAALDYLLALPPGHRTAAELQTRIEEERNAWGTP